MKDFIAHIEAELTRMLTCPRCDTTARFDDERCVICGMTRDQEGPAPRRILRGLSSLS